MELKQMLKYPLEPADLYNSILAPNLPYDRQTCEQLCVVNYWLPICNCTMFPEIMRYSGKPKNTTVCPSINYNDTDGRCASKNVSTKTPSSEYARCKCYKRCEGFGYFIAGYDKIQHGLGKN